MSGVKLLSGIRALIRTVQGLPARARKFQRSRRLVDVLSQCYVLPLDRCRARPDWHRNHEWSHRNKRLQCSEQSCENISTSCLMTWYTHRIVSYSSGLTSASVDAAPISARTTAGFGVGGSPAVQHTTLLTILYWSTGHYDVYESPPLADFIRNRHNYLGG